MRMASYTEVAADIVIQACENYLAMRAQRIERVRQAFIQSQMNPEHRWYHWIIGAPKPVTRERAEWIWENVEHPDYFCYTYKEAAENIGSLYTSTVRDILRIARNSLNGTIYLDTEAAFILDYVKE
jgi:hypothetical protein